MTLLEMPSATVRWQRHFPARAASVQWTGAHSGTPRQNPDDFRFSPDGSVLVAFSSLHAEWEFLDVRTGESLKTVRLLDDGATAIFMQNPVTSADGRCLLSCVRLPASPSPLDSRWLDWAQRWLPRRHHTLTVLHNPTTGEELLRLKIAGSAESHLAPNGQRVLTDSSPISTDVAYRRLQAWPVPARRPWILIVGVPLAGACALWTLRWAWRWRPRRG